MGNIERYDFIDVAKGIGIITVVIIHCFWFSHTPSLSKFGRLICYIYTMPLFFTVSGIFYRESDSFLTFCKKKANKLLIPFVSFYLISYIAAFLKSAFLGDEFDFLSIKRVLQEWIPGSNGAIWFLICLFICSLSFYGIHNIANRSHFKLAVITVLSAAIGACGFYFGINKINLPFWIDSAMTAIPFFTFGFILKNRLNFFECQTKRHLNLAVSIVLLIICGLYGKQYVLGTNTFGDNSIFSFYISCFCGVIAILLLSKNLSWCKFLSYLGKNSLIILITHQLLLYLFVNRIIVIVAEYAGSLGSVVSSLSVLFMALLFIASYFILIPMLSKIAPYSCARKNLIKL